jgi:hypothetical protein
LWPELFLQVFRLSLQEMQAKKQGVDPDEVAGEGTLLPDPVFGIAPPEPDYSDRVLEIHWKWEKQKLK